MPSLFPSLRLRRRVSAKPLTPAARAARRVARKEIMAKVEFWGRQMEIYPKRIAVKDQRSRWGSASSLGNLNFNWRITRMPEAVFEYVIIHELAHLREMNHSPAFWNIVAEFSPQHRAHRRWLRQHGGRMRSVK